MHAPLFGRYGSKIVGGLCGWEIMGLLPHSPIPPLTHLVRRHPAVGVVLLVLLADHWYFERVLVDQIADELGVVPQ
jgi:hypothetical protein